MPKYSVIIPAYNAGSTLPLLLESLAGQHFTDFETIVVDDGSTEEMQIETFAPSLRHYRQARRQGPAAARNRGAAQAQSPWLIFADADTVFEPDTLNKIDHAVTARPDAAAFVGTYAGRPANPGFMPRFKGLWEEVTIDGVLCARHTGEEFIPYTTWAPRPGMVRQDAFESVGGFDENFGGADLEDMDFGYRLVQAGHRIYFVPAICIHHHYPATLWRELKPFARRSALWMQMRPKHRGFDAAGEGTPKQALTHIFGFILPFLLAAGLFWPLIWGVAAPVAIAYLVLNRLFLMKAWKDEGLGFALRAFAVCWLHSVVLGTAASYGVFRYIINRFFHGFTISNHTE
jgi:glycosyltransferase involved in cell wall biosynthesis